MNSVKYFLAILTLFVVISCEDNPVNEREASRITRENFIEPGYTWFNPTYNSYEPDAAVIGQIKDSFDSSVHKLYIFVKPTCACTGTQYYFPNLIKSLDLAGIPSASYEMWGMSSETYNYPYKSEFNIKELPMFVVYKNNLPVYSIMDTVRNVFKVYPDSAVKVEYFLLQGLKR